MSETPHIFSTSDATYCVPLSVLDRMHTDHETAASAVRNLNNTDCGGRALRIDLADSDPFLEGKTTVHGEILDGAGETRAQWRQREKKDVPDESPLPRPSARDPSDFLKSLPQGVPLPPGTTALDATSHRLATIDPPQLTEVLAQMKVQQKTSTFDP